jgi:Ca2+-binding RTX toxin-like protein
MTFAPAVDRSPRPTEPLEPRRLLAATFNDDTGVLALTSGPENAIFEFEATFENGTEQFRVFQSTGSPTPPASTDPADLNAYLTAATDRRTFGPYDASAVTYVSIRTGSGSDLVIVGQQVDTPVDIDTAGGNDTVSGGAGPDTIVGNDGNDYIYGGGGDDNLTGAAGNDVLLGGDGLRDAVDYRPNTASQPVSVTFDGLANDGRSIELDNVGLDVEILIGGSGGDLLDASTRPESIIDRNGNRVTLPPVGLYGGSGGDVLRGTDGPDTLAGDAGFDELIAGAGDDLLLDANGDFDNLDAGAGTDTVVADAATTDTVTDAEFVLRPNEVFPAPATTTARSSRDAAGLVTVNGTQADDRITVVADGNTLRVRVTPVDVAGPGGFETVDEYDLLPPGQNDIPISGIFIDAGDGDDTVFVGDISVGGQGGTVVSATLLGGLGNDLLVGGAGNDLLDAGDDALAPGTFAFGRNLLFGRDGDDTLTGGFGADYISGGRGTDLADYRPRLDGVRVGLGGLFDDGLPGEGDNVRDDIEELAGTAGPDDLSTTAGFGVRLFGLAGNDTLTGNAGADDLIGGTGRDLMSGLGGADFFFASDGEPDTVSGGLGDDDGEFDPEDVGTFGDDN